MCFGGKDGLTQRHGEHKGFATVLFDGLFRQNHCRQNDVQQNDFCSTEKIWQDD